MYWKYVSAFKTYPVFYINMCSISSELNFGRAPAWEVRWSGWGGGGATNSKSGMHGMDGSWNIEKVDKSLACAKLSLFTCNWYQTVSFIIEKLCHIEWEGEGEREWPVPNIRCAYERSVTCLYLENQFSIGIDVLRDVGAYK